MCCKRIVITAVPGQKLRDIMGKSSVLRQKVQLEYDISPQQKALLGSICIIQFSSIMKLLKETRKNEKTFIRMLASKHA